jgi:hypothetical protein
MITSWALLVFMSFFTLITFVLAIFNPVSDCGCFGDALILTNWETFFKNLVLMVFVLLIFAGRREAPEGSRAGPEWILIGICFAAGLWFSIWNYRHLPLLDFRPYDVGTMIGQEMEIPEDAPVDQYETTLSYRERETGDVQEFTMENYPRDTSLWEFVTSESKLVKKGYEPPIHDFAISDAFGGDLVPGILADRGYTLLLISHDIRKADPSALVKATQWQSLERVAGDFRFYAVSSSPSSEVGEVVGELGLVYPLYSADEIMLKTMVRSNPGFILIGNGAILAKWAYRDLPTPEDVSPGITEMIQNASAPLDEEAQLLMEAGIYEDFSFDVVDFASLVPTLVLEKAQEKRENGVTITFVLAVLLLLLVFSRISPLRS